jgi:hypothetical protein
VVGQPLDCAYNAPECFIKNSLARSRTSRLVNHVAHAVLVTSLDELSPDGRRMLGYGSVHMGTGAGVENVTMIADPLLLRRAITAPTFDRAEKGRVGRAF